MASEVNRQDISVEDCSLLFRGYPRNLLTSAFGLRRLFPYGVAAVGCTKQLTRVLAGRSFAPTSQLRPSWAAPSKIMRSPRRLFKASRSRCRQRSSFRVSSTRGQPCGKVVLFRSVVLRKPSRTGGPSKRSRSGAVAPGCVLGSTSPTSGWRTLSSRSSLACLRSAVQLPGTVGQVSHGAGMRFVSFCARCCRLGQQPVGGLAWLSQGTSS
jgi:hypothetical protein